MNKIKIPAGQIVKATVIVYVTWIGLNTIDRQRGTILKKINYKLKEANRKWENAS